jgi:hypothetical protein
MIDTMAKYAVSLMFSASGIANPNSGSRNMYDSRLISMPVTN